MFDDRQTDTPVGDTTAADVDNEVPNKTQGVQADVHRRQKTDRTYAFVDT